MLHCNPTRLVSKPGSQTSSGLRGCCTIIYILYIPSYQSSNLEYILLCLLSLQTIALYILFHDESLTWPNLALRRHQVSEVVVRREWNWYRVVWARYCYLQNKLVCQGTKLLSAKEIGSLNCTFWVRSYDVFKPDLAVPLLRDCWTIWMNSVSRF